MLPQGRVDEAREYRTELPAEIGRKHFGPRLVAFCTLLVVRFHTSRRQLTALLGGLLDVPAPAL